MLESKSGYFLDFIALSKSNGPYAFQMSSITVGSDLKSVFSYDSIISPPVAILTIGVATIAAAGLLEVTTVALPSMATTAAMMAPTIIIIQKTKKIYLFPHSCFPFVGTTFSTAAVFIGAT